MNTEFLSFGDMQVEVNRKKIKNLHIGVYPPDGRVRIAAPEHVSMDAVRTAVLTRMAWIRRKQTQFRAQERQERRCYVSGETHYVFGQALRLDVETWQKKVHRIDRLGNGRLRLSVPEGATRKDRATWLNNWHRNLLRRTAAPKVEHWCDVLGVAPSFWGIRAMKTKWGSCNAKKRIVWLNAELSRKPDRAIDYIIVHELAHLISERHDDRFHAVLEKNMPRWRAVRKELNAFPLAAWEDTVDLA